MESTTSRENPAEAIDRDKVADTSFFLLNKLKRLTQNPSFRSAIFVFALTRGMILAILILVGVMSTVPAAFPDHFDTSISLYKKSVARTLRRVVRTADVNWYLGIAEDGYEKRAFEDSVPHNWAFFPVFPVIVRLASYITGEYALTGMFISHLCFLIGLYLLHRVALLFGFSMADADRAVFYLGVFPSSYFFSLPVSESVFFMITLSSFYFARREKWLLAGLLGALASGTRVTGVLLLPALAVLYWEMYRPISSFSKLRKSGLALLLVPAGLLGFMFYLRVITGNFMAFTGIQIAWGRRLSPFWMVLIEYLGNPAEIGAYWNFKLLNFVATVLALTCSVVLVRQKRFALALYTCISVLIATSTATLQSQARYTVVLFPVFLVLAVFGRNHWIDQTVRTISIALLGLMTALFAAHYTLALS